MIESPLTPVLFIGHGSPMNAIAENPYTESVRKMQSLCPSPRAVLCISAHWVTAGSWVTQAEHPRTIHDFGGFPEELYEIQYPAPGSPEVAELLIRAVGADKVRPDQGKWGLDHGAWSVLR